MNNILFQAIAWHFYDAPMGIIKAWKDFLYFSLNYFSVPTLLKTFFSPWRKNAESYSSPVEVWKNIETFIFNSMSRIIGAILRTFFIILGIVSSLLVFIVGIIIITIWVVSPLLLIFAFLVGINILL